MSVNHALMFSGPPWKWTLPEEEAKPSLARVKIGFFGGSFDPVHFGHLCAAQDACEQHRLDRLIFVPAAQAPLKPHKTQSSAEHRLGMLRAALNADSRFEISDYELRHGGVSYTIESVRYFLTQFPRDRLFWIIGGDQVAQLPLWKDIRELIQLIEFISIGRPGQTGTVAPDLPGLRLHGCAGHLLEISSTELRDRARLGLPLDYFVPHKTVVYIKENGLYRQTT
ncbi:MAG: nicotinate-nucleotide adenylyltransferase [Opitutaceae bacterium]|jgi:nicotinate-nucleotide adenylyltransferase